MNINEKIKQEIDKKGIKYAFLSKKINLSKQLFHYKLKNGFKTDEIFKLASILNIDLNQFKEA